MAAIGAITRAAALPRTVVRNPRAWNKFQSGAYVNNGLAPRVSYSTKLHLPRSVRPHQIALRSSFTQIRYQHQASQDTGELASASLQDVTLNQRIQLRDSCTCPRCVSPSTQQKEFQTCDIPLDIGIRERHNTENGFSITWNNDIPGFDESHTSHYSLKPPSSRTEQTTGAPKRLWDREIITRENLWMPYKDYAHDDKQLYKTLKHLTTHGLAFITDAGDAPETIVSFAERIGHLKDTFYGATWDVQSKPDAKNVAYTHQFLGLHMDLLYTTNPPHLQFLHSLRARAPGGSSLFTDAFAAATHLFRTAPTHFRTLCTVPVPYHYHNDNQHYHLTRPTIETSGTLPSGEPRITRVNWSPPFQAPFPRGESRMAEYLAAAKAFDGLLSGEEALFEYRLQEGECVVFDNRRVLHARREFDARKGERWLRGCYVDDDAFLSRLRVLGEKFGEEAG